MHVDAHHTTEDVGICLGQALQKAVGDKVGMIRFGSFTVPMYETLAKVDLDICGRPFSALRNTAFDSGKVGEFDIELT